MTIATRIRQRRPKPAEKRIAGARRRSVTAIWPHGDELGLDPLHGVQQRLPFRQGSRVVPRRLRAARIRLSANLARLAGAEILGAVVSVSQAPGDGLELIHGLAHDFGRPSDADQLTLGKWGPSC